MVVRWSVLSLVLLLGSALAAQNETTAKSSGDQLKIDAETAYSQGDFAKCIELSSKALEASANDHLALYLRASARVELGQIDRDAKMVRAGIEDARASLKALGKLEANYYLPYLYGMTTLAQLENRPEHAETAIGIADSLVTKDAIPAEQKANIYYQRAVANLVRRQPKEAVKDYQSAIQAFPKHLGARIGLAESYIQANDLDKALAAFTAAVQTFPDNPLVYNNRGMFLQQRGKTKEAVADFSKAIELDPKFAVALTNRGFSSLNSGQHAAAEADFTTAIQLEPKAPLPYSLRGTCRLAQGKIDAALEDYQEAAKLDPKNPTTSADIAFAKLFAKDFSASHESFTQTLKTDPNLRYLAPWLLWTGTLSGQEVVPEVAKSSAAKPAEQRDWVDHLTLFLTGEETAEQLLTAAKAKDPLLQSAQECEAHFFIGEKAAQAGDQQKAEAEYRAAIATKAINLSAYRGAQFALKQIPK